MARLNILRYPDARPHKVAAPVTVFDESLKQLVADMAETMYAAPGIGLAAIQVDVPKQVIVVDVSERRDSLVVLVNPEIVEANGVSDIEEGCLSVPGIYELVERAERVKVRAHDQNGNPCTARCSSSTCRPSSSSAFAPSSRSSCARPPDRRAFLRLVFAGTPEFAERALARIVDAGHQVVLVLTQPDRPAGRGMRAAASPVKRFALERGLPLFQPPSLKNEAERVRAAHADALVVAAYGLLLPPPVLEAAHHGAFNIHAS